MCKNKLTTRAKKIHDQDEIDNFTWPDNNPNNNNCHSTHNEITKSQMSRNFLVFTFYQTITYISCQTNIITKILCFFSFDTIDRLFFCSKRNWLLFCSLKSFKRERLVFVLCTKERSFDNQQREERREKSKEARIKSSQ